MRLLRLIAASACIALATAGSAMAITGGRPDGSAHPYVGFARDGTTFCSGSLVSRTVFVTAGHCFASGSSVQVSFDPAGVTNTARLNFSGVVHVDPGFCGGCGSGVAGFASHDVAVVTFSAPIPSTVVPRLAALPAPNLTTGLKVHTPIDLVGYGIQSFTNGGGQPQPATGGSRFWGTSELAQAGASAAPTLLKLASASSGAGSCFGDSGGPVLLGGTDTILAVNSFLPSSFCQGVSYAYRLDTPDELAFVDGFLS